MFFNPLVEQRLGDGGIVDFAVAVTAVADQIDDDIGAELVAVFHGQASDANDGVDVFAVDVEDGNRLAARDACGETRGMLFGVAGGESQQIVDDHVNGAADGVAGKIGVIHGLGKNALPGECSVAVDEQWQILFAPAFTAAVLFGTSAANGHRIDGFEVAGIGNQMDVNFVAAARGVFARRAHVVFHVAGAEYAARVDILEAGEDFLGISFGNVGDHVKASAMAHTHHQFRGSEAGTGIEEFIDQRNERGDAFERKPLAAEIALLHDLLEHIGADQQVEDARLIFRLRFGFHALVDPTPALGSVDVIDLYADG